MPDASNDEFLFTCPSCSFEQPVPLEKRGSAIVCKGCNSTVFVPSEEAVDDTEDEYALSSEWEEPKRSVPVYASEEESLPLAGGTEKDTIREPEPAEEEEAEEEEEEGYHRPELPERPMFTGVLGFLATKEAIVLTIGLTIAGAIVLSLQLAGLVFDSVGSSGDGEVGGIGKFFAFLTWGTLGLMWAVWAFEAGLTVLQEAAGRFRSN